VITQAYTLDDFNQLPLSHFSLAWLTKSEKNIFKQHKLYTKFWNYFVIQNKSDAEPRISHMRQINNSEEQMLKQFDMKYWFYLWNKTWIDSPLFQVMDDLMKEFLAMCEDASPVASASSSSSDLSRPGWTKRKSNEANEGARKKPKIEENNCGILALSASEELINSPTVRAQTDHEIPKILSNTKKKLKHWC
jgi:hypothetical protein